ncbi:MAG: glycosyltransferase [Actinomycetota bacterium]|nr:glycosyltransferase [Actinomycetota bacterium]
MARILIVTWDGGGNVPPAFAIGQTLAKDHHEVVIGGQELSQPSDPHIVRTHRALEERSKERALPFHSLPRSAAKWEALSPEQRVVGAVMACDAHLVDLAEAVADFAPDVVAVDCLMFGALTAMEDAGIPTATIVHSAPGLLMEPGGAMEGFLLGPVNDVRDGAGLRRVKRLWDAWSVFPSICTTIPELDPLADSAPQSFKYIGPVFDSWVPSSAVDLLDRDDPRPVVLVSFASSSAWDQRSRVQRTVDALAGAFYRLLLTTSLTDVAGVALPDDALVAQHVPHHQVMPHVSVMVTHAGHGSVATALAHGVPLVCLPNPIADQPGIARQVESLGAGLALDGEAATSEEIGDAVKQVLSDPSYGAVARRLGGLITTTSGATSAAETLLRLARR